MATATLPHFDVTPTFQNIVATIVDAASVDGEVQNVGAVDVEVVVKASGSAPDRASTTGMIFRPRERFKFNAAQIWVRTRGVGNSRVSLTTTS